MPCVFGTTHSLEGSQHLTQHFPVVLGGKGSSEILKAYSGCLKGFQREESRSQAPFYWLCAVTAQP